jgi:putative ATP-binding cassette transporter
MNLLFSLLRMSWPTVLLASILGAVSGVASIVLIALIHQTLKLKNPTEASALLIGLFAAFCVVVLATRILTQLLLTRIAQYSVSRVRMGFCRRILQSPLRKLEEIGDHRMLASLTGDGNTISIAANGLPVLCVNIVILLTGGAYLGWLSPGLLGCAVVVCVLGVVSFQISSRYAGRYVKQGREAQDNLMKQFRTMIDGLKELKLHRDRREEFVDDVLVPADAEVRDNQTLGFSLQVAAISWGRLMFFLAIGLLLFAWPYIRAIDGATLTGYVLVILYLMSPLERILAWLPLLERALVSVRKMQRLGLALEEEQPETFNAETPGDWQRIEMTGVTHTYHRQGEAHDFLLGPIELALHPGEILFVIGGNGSGKTTLAKLITGLYAPEEGEIRLDGRPVTPDNREAYRQLFTVIFDNAVVFESLLGMEGHDLDERAREYLRQLELDRVVTVTDRVFSSTKLSRGQRKRLALVTAYLEDRPIYVFDEWAADQDPTFKRVFYEQLLPDLKLRGKSVVAITHDDRYFSAADRVVKLEEGRIVQQQETSHEMVMDNSA